MTETAFILLALICDRGTHTNGCWYEHTEFPSRQACIAEMTAKDEFTPWLMRTPQIRDRYEQRQVMCLSADAVALP